MAELIRAHLTEHVPESQFGIWFLGTRTWARHVLERALNDLQRLIPNPRPSYPVVLDIGCGWGRSFKLLRDRFAPRRLIGIDIDPQMLAVSEQEARDNRLTVELMQSSASRIPLSDGAVDLVFCHQTFHHLTQQEAALQEFFRVLKPGGMLLMAESTRSYIHSWIIRLLFRHDMTVQRSADEYLAMIRAAGFRVEPSSISYPYLWWSRTDLGIRERVFGISPSRDHEETLINLVALRP